VVDCLVLMSQRHAARDHGLCDAVEGEDENRSGREEKPPRRER
jgi:hypothetical protein